MWSYIILNILKYHGQVITNMRAAVAATNGKRICGIMLDTKGPEIRTGKLVDKKEIDLVAGQYIKVSSDPSTIVCIKEIKMSGAWSAGRKDVVQGVKAGINNI